MEFVSEEITIEFLKRVATFDHSLTSLVQIVNGLLQKKFSFVKLNHSNTTITKLNKIDFIKTFLLFTTLFSNNVYPEYDHIVLFRGPKREINVNFQSLHLLIECDIYIHFVKTPCFMINYVVHPIKTNLFTDGIFVESPTFTQLIFHTVFGGHYP